MSDFEIVLTIVGVALLGILAGLAFVLDPGEDDGRYDYR